MPVLDNHRWEAYAHQRASGVPSVQAAANVGYRTPNVDCAKLNKRKAVLDRIEELRPQYGKLQADAVASVVVPTREGVLRDLIEIREAAKAAGRLQERIKANELIGKELGMFTVRVDAKVDSPLDRLPAATLVAVLAALERDDVEFVGSQQVIEHEPEQPDDPLA